PRRFGAVVWVPGEDAPMARKLLDVSHLSATGWRPKYTLRDGLKQTYAWFLEHVGGGDIRLGPA
ncbi:MAG: hypothetical protein J0H31_20995, partial [Alphaproteobacteria bacterium]|nr:hypothetical protein [Alphaproteobacteria bacterium]